MHRLQVELLEVIVSAMASFYGRKIKIDSEYSSVRKIWKVEFIRKVYYYRRVYAIES